MTTVTFQNKLKDVIYIEITKQITPLLFESNDMKQLHITNKKYPKTYGKPILSNLLKIIKIVKDEQKFEDYNTLASGISMEALSHEVMLNYFIKEENTNILVNEQAMTEKKIWCRIKLLSGNDTTISYRE